MLFKSLHEDLGEDPWSWTHGNCTWVGLNTPIEHGSEAKFGGVHFSGPLCFGPLGTFFGFFAKFGSYSPKLL